VASYWSRVLAQRTYSRRKLLTASGAGTAALALSLIGCGGGNDESPGASGLLTKADDSTKQAKPGGAWSLLSPTEPPNIDPMTSTDFAGNFPGFFVYSRLIK
jgi:hypothetical protein